MSDLMHRLKALAVLQAVLETGSFSQAAQRLFITQSAVSQHVKQLEATLGPLFVRGPRQLIPTPLAEGLRPYLSQGFAQLQAGWQQAQGRQDNQVVTITVLPSFASCWLFPRLPSFNRCCPEIELRLSVSDQVQDLTAGGLDLAIRFGQGQYPGLVVERLMDDELFPVAAPSLLASQGTPASPADLADYLLLRDNSPPTMNWPGWLAKAGQRDLAVRYGMMVSDAGQLLGMAQAGLGIALARRSLLGTSLEDGRLTRLFDIGLLSPFAYYLVQRPQSAGRPAVGRFVRWLRQEIRQPGAGCGAS